MIPAPQLFTVVKGELFIGDTWPPVPKNGCIASCESWREIYPKDLCDALQACGWRVGRLAMKLTIIMIRSSNTLVLCVLFLWWKTPIPMTGMKEEIKVITGERLWFPWPLV